MINYLTMVLRYQTVLTIFEIHLNTPAWILKNINSLFIYFYVC